MSAPTAVAEKPELERRIRYWIQSTKFRLTDRFKESTLEKYAREEMQRAGLYDEDANYGPGAIADQVMKMVRILGRGGHSGGSHHMLMAILDRVANFRPLTPISADPSEWMNVTEYGRGPGEAGVWQNRRKSTCFSNDPAFGSYYDIDEKGRPLHVLEPWPKR